MPSRAVAVLGSLAFAIAAGGVGLGVAQATGSPTTKTFHLSAKFGAIETVGKHRFVVDGTLTSRKLATRGDALGYVSEACTSNAKGTVYHCNSAFTVSGGIMLSRETVNLQNPTTHGVVTGGDGIYSGVRGSLSEQDEDTGITIIDLTVTTK